MWKLNLPAFQLDTDGRKFVDSANCLLPPAHGGGGRGQVWNVWLNLATSISRRVVSFLLPPTICSVVVIFLNKIFLTWLEQCWDLTVLPSTFPPFGSPTQALLRLTPPGARWVVLVVSQFGFVSNLF